MLVTLKTFYRSLIHKGI